MRRYCGFESLGYCIYVYCVHPELRSGDCRSGTGKGAGLLYRRSTREHKGSKREQAEAFSHFLSVNILAISTHR